MTPEVQLWADGSGTRRGNPGGWACVLIFGETQRLLFGGAMDATNNTMELTAVIKGFQALKRVCRVHVFSDSEYVVNAFLQNWFNAWDRKKWKGVKNPELWHELRRLAQHHDTTWHHVKGHSGVEFNELCDKHAGECRTKVKAMIAGELDISELQFEVEGYVGQLELA